MADHGVDLSEEDLLLLARDRSIVVRYWLATLPGSTLQIYELLAQDPDQIIATAARASLMAPYSRARTGSSDSKPGE